jgi:ribose transport system ATP-binding protein
MASLLSMRKIRKDFCGITVLDDVCFEAMPGEVHILAGENGAGKTTLINVLAGVHTDYRGKVELDGRSVRFTSPSDAARQGISVIHQEMSLIGTLPVVDNIFLGRELTKPYSRGLLVDQKREIARAEELCALLDLDIDVVQPVENFPLSVKNRIEIAKALAFNARIVVMDEPTSALSVPEVERLFDIIRDLRRHGTAIIYITHRMEEIYRIGDRITVLRDGRLVGTGPATEINESKLICWMAGREVSVRFPSRSRCRGEQLLRVERFSVARHRETSASGRRWLVRDASFVAHSGEVLGLVGLQGAGASALLAGIFGVYPKSVEGEVWIRAERLRGRTPLAAVSQGLAYLGSDRRETGLIFGLDVAQNISLASLKKLSPWGVLRKDKELNMATRQVKSLGIRGALLSQDVQTLSGGNQQKVLLARWVETDPKVFLLDEPTRGVDVAAKHEIYKLINKWTEAGSAVVMVTSELEELMGLSDRILVMHRGRICAEFPRDRASRESILRAAMGGTCSSRN